MFARWGSSLSTGFRVTNGVRQGGVLSPLLFNAYMYINDLSIQLSQTGIGDSTDGKFVLMFSYTLPFVNGGAHYCMCNGIVLTY